MVFRAAKEKDEDVARKKSCVTRRAAHDGHVTRWSCLKGKRSSAFRYKVVVDLHARFAGLCKVVEEEGQVAAPLIIPHQM